MKRQIFFLVLIFGLIGFKIANAQSADENLVKLADEMYGFGDKKDALAVYLQAIEVNPDNVTANYMAGKCYLETVGKELSVNYLIKAYELKPIVSPDVLFKIGNGFQFGGKFDDAIRYYTRYKENINEAKAKLIGSTMKDEVIKTERKIFECKNGSNYYANVNHFRIENLKDVVNSEYADYAPSVNADQNTMIFTSRRAGGVGKNKDIDNEYFEDIWITKKDDKGEWGNPENLGAPVNSESHDGSIGLSPDGKKIFMYKPDNGGDIFVTELMPDGKWATPTNISTNINTKFNEPSVSITKEGKTLYFSSNKPGGFGGFDIYRSEADKTGKWGKAQNMGSIFNTEYDEDAPFIDLDGKTLYFSSRGHKGMGGYDLYKSVYDSTLKKWSEPLNMGYPLNSPDDDIYFVIAGNGKTGYYASAKGDGFGDKDIYKIFFEDPKEITEVEEVPFKKENIVKKDSIPPVIAKKDTVASRPLVAKKDSIAAPIVTAKKDTIAPAPVAKTELPEPTPTPVAKTQKPVSNKTDKVVPAPVAKKENIVANKTEEIIPAPVTQPKPTEPTPIPVAESKEPSPELIAQKEAIPQSIPVAVVPVPKPVPVKKEIVLYPTILKGSVYDQRTSTPLAAKITISDSKGNVLNELVTQEDGVFSAEFSTKVPAKYIITVNKEGFIYANINVTLPANAKAQKIVNKDIALKKVDVGQVFVLRNIYFEFDKANIKKESFPYIDNLYKWLKSHSSINLEISGHTDNLGLDSYNKILSQRRVDAVMRYLTAKGIRGERLVAIGYGEERPIASNDDDQEGREINRRTEFKITKQ